jgi:hypothetical protein
MVNKVSMVISECVFRYLQHINMVKHIVYIKMSASFFCHFEDFYNQNCQTGLHYMATNLNNQIAKSITTSNARVEYCK